MKKRILAVLLSALILASVTACNTPPKKAAEETTESSQKEQFTELTSPYFDWKEGSGELTQAELSAVITKIPSDHYEVYRDQHTRPISATLYKNGEEIVIDVDDPRLVSLTNFFNDTLHQKQCAYSQSYLPLSKLQENVSHQDFRLELKYEPQGKHYPSPYGTETSMSDTMIVLNGGYNFVLMNHNRPGYEHDPEKYPILALSIMPLGGRYPWLDLFGF